MAKVTLIIIAFLATIVAILATLGVSMPGLASLLFREYRRKVFALLLLHPDDKYHVHAIARLTGTVAGTLHKELSKLATVGILNKDSSGNQVLYSANRNCPIYSELSSIMKKTSGLVDILAEALESISKNIDFAFIFGSIASGKETSGSDIDLFILGEIEYPKVIKSVYPIQSILGREINPKIFNHKEWEKAKKKKDAFIKEVIKNPKLFIIGMENEFG